MACVSLRSLLVVVLSQCLCGLVDAGQKRHKGDKLRGAPRPLVGAAWAHTRDVTRSIQDVLRLSLGEDAGQAADVRLPRLKESLRPLFRALPKNSKGLLGHSTVRYALHRHFMHHHGMYIKGLDPVGEAWNSSSPAEILEERVPAYVQHVLEQRLEGGFDLEELSVLAAALEHFVHIDAVERLKVIYELTNRSTEEEVSPDEVTSLMERYLVIQMEGLNSKVTASALEGQWRTMRLRYSSWPDTQTWLRGIQESVLEDDLDAASRVHGGSVNFQAVKKVLEAVTERFGRQQNSDCKEMGHRLIAKDTQASGRIKLPDFYKAGGQFAEKKEYLAELGAIEEKLSPEGKLEATFVLLPNYLQSIANCLPSSSMYTVCCLNQCEELLRHLEIQIGAPTAAPEELIKIVEALPSSTVEAPRHLPDVLVQRLNEIASSHDFEGRVPLHGRLFSQWLHHVYPRECPMPAKSGTIRPITPSDWLREQNASSTITKQEISEMLRAEKKPEGMLLRSNVQEAAAGQKEESLPWDLDEELVFHQVQPSLFDELRTVLRAIAMIGAIGGLLWSLAELVSSTVTSTGSRFKKWRAAKRAV